MLRRFPIWCVAATMSVSVSLVLSSGWDRPPLRLVSAAAWLAGLAVLWMGAWAADARPQAGVSRIGRHPVGPPLSPETERIALAAVFIVALAFRFVLLADVPPSIAQDETMFSFETSWRLEHADLYGLSLLESWPVGWFPHLFGIG